MADSSLKWIALVALVVQNSGLALAMRYTMVYPSADGRYYASTAVVAAEMLKFAIAFVLFYVSDCKGKFSEFKRISKIELVDNRMDWLKLTVPSILYTLQNSLQYFSMTQLSAPVFQVLYQMKIVTTAIFSVSILARRITSLQWLSIVALSGGVALVQLSQTQHSSTHSNSFIGFVSVICGCFTSGFAGVYFEMVLKSSKASIWLRNIQLAVIGMVTGGIACYMRDGDLIANNGFLFGYNNAVYFVVFLQAAGGLVRKFIRALN
jgi:UDP-sugar transporter A1/2/3